MRKPRLNNAVATVAVETVFSLLRVASESFDMAYSPLFSSFRDVPPRQTSEAILRGRRRPGIHFSQYSFGTMDSGLQALPRPGMTVKLKKSRARRPACQTRFQEN